VEIRDQNQKSNIGNTSGVDFGQNAGGSLLQLAAPIFSPRSVKLFMVSFTKVPATGGYQSPGIDTTRTSGSALRLSLATSAIAEVPHCGRRRSTRDSVQAPLMTAAQFAGLADCVAGISNSFCERLLRDEARSSNPPVSTGAFEIRSLW
jgi:hypothetical protein